ncbi:nitroreductase family protein [Clostridium sp. E02]|uniref:nitroreductase family protein n=1 Tax=Clostridium sp. E02 TaxID=2487134 RepID=UPI000F532FD4|nr:nitroreductase family protein [Clostridium sp. E02]
MEEFYFPVEQTIRNRHSERTYDPRPLSADVKEKIQSFIRESDNPFHVKVSFYLLASNSDKGQKLGTYGVIKGVSDFIGSTVKEEELGLEALGYSMEHLILFLTSQGLGSCWLGGTFDRSAFSQAIHLEEGILFPIITPVGYPVEKKRPVESLIKWAAKSSQRKDWEHLFFKDDFTTPLTKQEAGAYEFALEMVRLAPSAINKQPWRIIKKQNAFHFYEAKTRKENKPLDIQRVDVGIAACHFHLAAIDKHLNGSFLKVNPGISAPPEMSYLFSWVIEE